MTARRQALAARGSSAIRTHIEQSPDGVPLLLTEQPAIDVWAVPGLDGSDAWWSARTRFLTARDGWLWHAGITEVADQCRLLPHGAVRPRPDSGLTGAALAEQRAEAQELLDIAARTEPLATASESV